MKTILKYGIFVAVIVSLTVTGYSDTLILKNGERISGYYEGGTSRVIRFSTDAGTQEYDLLSVLGIEFGGDVVSSTPRVDAPPVLERQDARVEAERLDEGVRLQTREESLTPPAADQAANTAFTVPVGSNLLIRMIDSIDSETDAVGKVFTARLEEPLFVERIEVAPRGSDVRGRIANVESAGRVSGSAELQLELTQIIINGIPYALNTSEYEEVAEGRGNETARRVGTGAGVGALIGLIAGGGKGAAIGAGVGAGAAGAVQVLTKGEKLYIPSETLLGFSLREPLVIAAR
jgi:hypothetical protein